MAFLHGIERSVATQLAALKKELEKELGSRSRIASKKSKANRHDEMSRLLIRSLDSTKQLIQTLDGAQLDVFGRLAIYDFSELVQLMYLLGIEFQKSKPGRSKQLTETMRAAIKSYEAGVPVKQLNVSRSGLSAALKKAGIQPNRKNNVRRSKKRTKGGSRLV